MHAADFVAQWRAGAPAFDLNERAVGALIPADLPAEVRAHAEAIAQAAHRLVTLRDAWLNPPEWTERVPEVVPLGMSVSPYPDPIRAPARAQDLTLRHRVKDYSAGDLERRYARLPIEEDFFVNYGFLPRETAALMHPRTALTAWTPARWKQAHAVLDFVRERGLVHPAEVDAHFQHGLARNWFGGSSRASTQLMDSMHYRGLLRTARRLSLIHISEPTRPD